MCFKVRTESGAALTTESYVPMCGDFVMYGEAHLTGVIVGITDDNVAIEHLDGTIAIRFWDDVTPLITVRRPD